MKPRACALPLLIWAVFGCSSDNAASGVAAGGIGGAAGGDTASGAGGLAAGGANAGGAFGSSPAGAAAVAGGAENAGAGRSGSAGTSSSNGGASGAAGSSGASGAAGSSGASGAAGSSAAGSVNALPADYKGTPFTALKIPGRINAADYDRGGAGVAYCHDLGNCGAGTVTGDYPSGSGVYRPAMPANAKLCSGAACDDNVGVCRMNPSKPDNTIAGQPMPTTDTYLCYSVAGEWTKYTVVVAEAGTYSVSGTVAVPQNGGVNLSFGDTITTGNLSLAITPTTNSGSGESYHSWDTRSGLATVTFPAAGTYLMTLTQVGRFNADNFTFTKM